MNSGRKMLIGKRFCKTAETRPRTLKIVIPFPGIRRSLMAMRVLTVFLGCLLVASAQAEVEALKSELISEVSAAEPGKTFLVGLHLQHPPGTHTYWKFPGIVGLATRIDWSPPEGVKVGEIQWPAPEKVMMANYEAQGYEGETLLMCPVTLPAGFKEKTLVLKAKVSWMHCGKTCHPATNLPFSISLPVGPALENETTQPLFKKFQALVPQPEPLWKVSVKRGGNWIHLSLESTDPTRTRPSSDLGPIHFFTEDGQVDSNSPQESAFLNDDKFKIKMSVSEFSPKDSIALPGVLVAERGWLKEGGPKSIAIRPAY